MSDGLKDALNNLFCKTCTKPTFGSSNAQLCNCVNGGVSVEDAFPKTRSELKDGVTVIRESNIALKFDTSKIPLELLPTQALEEIAKVLDFGKKKYAAWNWAKGFKWTRLIGASLRHLYAYSRGEDKDPESGLSHLAHAGCCILFLLQHEISGLGEDDRYKGFIKQGDKDVQG